MRFPRQFDRHLAVPIGLPANAISFIVVGGKVAPEMVQKLRTLVEQHKLPAKIVDCAGVFIN